MDLKQMEYFKTIVDQGSINQAAKILHMSQPPLSMSIKKLEDELGALLLIRGNKHISLTEAGKIFYQRSCSILELADSTASEVSKAGSQRTFALGLTPSTIPVVSDMLARFSNTFPEVKYRIYDGSTLELSHLLDTDALDAAFLRTPFATGALKSIPIRKEPMVAAIPKALLTSSIKLKSRDYITLEELSTFPISIYRRYQQLLEDTMSAEGFTLNIFSLCDDTRTSLLWVRNKKAVAVYPLSLKDDSGEDFIILPIKCKSLETSILFVYPSENGKTSELVRDFLPFIS
ncbi:LysR family transcriptional regulator [Butyrivibrio sp. AE3004]|uniref:LysR family transcriptional regulator n=1 Tax=Butyrivibrio sp. AE3004 TaxID=1506994 RepID=UPI0004949071|nr:LysR family transcriptional regulator [Butyrivibrio sp. AE3004]